jgi:hypothetical protein
VRIAGEEEVRQQSESEDQERSPEGQVMRATIGTAAGRRRRSLAAAIAVVALGATAGPAVGVEPPQWHITMEHHNPYGAQGGFDPFTEKEGDKGETFARESGYNAYTIKVENSAGGTSNGPVTVSDHLPKGIVLGGATEEAVGKEWACTVVEHGEEATCSTAAPLEVKKSFPPITLHVYVAPQAANPSTNVAQVIGGGALPPPASSTPEEGKTTITEAVPFGIDVFTTSVVDSLGNPFSQAGGHPFAASTEFVLNYTTDETEGLLGPAGGAVKEIQAEVPPGFIGNPLNTPRCPIALLKGNNCPANTAVGYTHLVLAGGKPGGEIVGGKARIFPDKNSDAFSSLVYNMEPAPGSPAQLGFGFVGGLPFLLDAKVRSDGDYGVTVGDSAVGEKPLAATVTLCSNGAGGVGPNFTCNAAPPSSKPFLTNPTQCSSSAPVTTLKANPWVEQKNFVSKTVYTGTHLVEGKPSQKESFVTGCKLLQFNPQLEFKPSATSEGGTTRADAPTGMTFNLKLPQSNEAAVPATPELKNLVMALPAGMTVSPGASDGLQACSNAQFGLGTEFGPGSAHTEPAKPATCPLASQIGTVEIFTPLLSGAPTIEGVPAKGHELTCSEGAWSVHKPTLSYQWLRRGEREGKPVAEAIAGATGNEYAPVTEDAGEALQCQVTATNASGSSVAVSRQAVVSPEPSPLPPFPPPSIAAPGGTASVGNTLTCAAGAWTGDKGEKVAFAYQWLRGGVPIAGAASETYTLATEDAGKVIQCQVTGKNESKPEGGVIADSAAVVVSPAPSTPPLPGTPLQGQLFVAEPECSPCTESNHDAENGKLFRLFLQVNDPERCPPASSRSACDGVIVKLHGTTFADEKTGQLTAAFLEQPQQPFELAQVKLKGGPRAPLANPQTCGPVETVAELTPWSAPGLGGLTGDEPIPGTPPAKPSSRFEVEGCPPAVPFNPSFNAGTTGPTATNAGAFTKFSLTFGREDREQDLSGVEVHLPLGLVGKIAAVKQCGEAEVRAAERNEGECPAESQIGTATAGAGSGPHPFFDDKGKVYLTGPYNGGPFGVAVVTPAVAGPFNLGNIVVRAAIMVDPNTAAVTTVSDPLPQLKDGVQLRVRKVYVEVNNPGFMLNPTNCKRQQVSATLTSARNASAQVSSPFGIGGCGNLPFHPEFTAEVGGHGSRANGTSFVVKVKSAPGQANIAKTYLQLPLELPSRLTTIQKACLAAVFEANPASCGEGSNIGMAIAHTPLLKNPLVGPAYLVSHGNAAFPDVEFVLQGEGITIILDGKTDIKKGITYSRFETLPDAPVSTFETVLPAGPHSALTTNVPESDNYSLCKTSLVMPTEITGQNGAVIKQNTKIALAGCAAAKATVKIAKVKVKGNTLLVTVTTTATGTVRISGKGLKTTNETAAAGTHQIRVPLTKTGRSMRRHHKQTIVHVSLTVGKSVVAKGATVRL